MSDKSFDASSLVRLLNAEHGFQSEGFVFDVTRVGELTLPTRTLVFDGGWFGDTDRWPSTSERMEVIAHRVRSGDEVAESLSVWIVRVPQPGPIVRWVDGGFEDAARVGDSEAVDLEPDPEWPQHMYGREIEIKSNVLQVNGPDLSVAHAFLGLDTQNRVVALVVITD